MNRLKKISVRVWIIISICILVAVAGVSGTYAVYTNQGYKKGVVMTTPMKALFSSNLLEQISMTDISDKTKIKVKDIVVTSIGNNKVRFTFDVYNYAPNTPSRVNTNDIKYDLAVSTVANKDCDFSVNGNASSSNACTVADNFLSRGTARYNTFTIECSKTAANSGIQFLISAKPQPDYRNYVNGIGLASIVGMKLSSGGAAVVNSWDGAWVEASVAGLKPSDCSAFNYEISGTGKGQVTVTCPQGLTFDTEHLKYIGITESIVGDSVTFDVNSENKAVYTLRFYRNGSLSFGEDSFRGWSSISTFKPAT